MITGHRSTNDENGKANQMLFLNMVTNDTKYRQKLLDKLNIPFDDYVDIEEKAGRRYNYDFALNTKHGVYKLELKVGRNLDTIYKLPEILQLSINQMSEYMKDYIELCFNTWKSSTLKYLNDNKIKCSELNELQFNTYYGHVYNNKYNIHTLYPEIYNMYKKDKRYNKLLSSIYHSLTEQYLNSLKDTKYVNIIVSYLIERIKEQTDKVFILFNSSDTKAEYNINYIQNFEYIDYEIDKCNIVLNTNLYKFKCLLRWKNGNLLANPAFQISVSKKTATDLQHINKQPIMCSLSHVGMKLTKMLTREDKRKNGIYFTPTSIVNKCYELLSKHIVSKDGLHICEPSCGSMEFVVNENIKLFPNCRFTCYELNDVIYKEITESVSIKNCQLFHGDYLKTSIDDKFNVIIGNPPYFVTKEKTYNEYYTGRPNIYIQFIIHSLKKLKKDGILCFVLPTTLMSSQYYEKTREYIIKEFTILELILNTDKFKDTSYDTFILVVKNSVDIVANNKYVINGMLTPYKETFNRMLECKHYYLNSIGNILNGWYVWNQHKDDLTDRNNKEHTRCILYYANEKRTNYIKHYKGNKICHDVIVFYRGNGNASFKWKPRMIRYTGNGIVLENHLLYLVPNEGVDIDEVFKLLTKKETKQFAEMFVMSGSITTKTLLNNIPVFKD